jgi:hypothetical protein
VQPNQQQQQQQQQRGGACCWPHLLHLHEGPELVAAVQQAQQAYVDSCWQFVMNSCRTSSSIASSSSSSSCSSTLPRQAVAAPHAQELEQEDSAEQHKERLEGLMNSVKFMCWALAAAVPLPEVCNNPSCRSLVGVSEAAAAVKACGGCGACYCSRECQEAHWAVHRKACRRLRGARA